MTDLAMEAIVGETILRLALWTDGYGADLDLGLGVTLPAPCRAVAVGDGRLLWLEAGHWLLTCPAAMAATIEAEVGARLGDAGTIVEVGAALAGRRLTGRGWRDLLMVGGVFDAEDPRFGPGCVARTVMHHAALLIDVIADDRVDAYVPASHAEDFFGFWERWIARRDGAPAPGFRTAP